MGDVIDFVTGKSGEDAAVAAKDAATIAAQGQTEALEYLKEREKIPRILSERGLTRLGGLFGLVRGVEGADVQEDILDKVRASPLFASIMGTQRAGEEAILRNAAATGGLRSGNVQQALAEQAQSLEERALLTGYQQEVQGLTGLAGLPSMAPQIAQATAAPAITTAQGITAGAQAQQANTAGLMQGLFNVGGGVLSGMAMAGAFCDSRLKKNVKPAGKRLGHNWYTWDWNEKAEELFGLKGKGEGVMAHELAETLPEAVGLSQSGYLIVDYEALL